jgi:hypothetical protein
MIFLDNLQDNVHHILLGMENLKILGGTGLIAQGRAHQDLLHAPTIWVTMSAVANINLKSMVQTINNIKMANNKDIMKSPHTRTSTTTTTTPPGGSPQELQDR